MTCTRLCPHKIYPNSCIAIAIDQMEEKSSVDTLAVCEVVTMRVGNDCNPELNKLKFIAVKHRKLFRFNDGIFIELTIFFEKMVS